MGRWAKELWTVADAMLFCAAEMNSDIVVRRATADDYEAVLNIADDDLWDGNDYLPTLYHVFLQTKRHVFYVAEINGRVVKMQQNV